MLAQEMLQPGANVQLPDDTVERLLGTWPVARLATLGATGAPHLVPIVFAPSGGALWSPVDAKPKSGRGLARVEHLRRDPRASLLLDAYEPDWTRLWWVRLDALGSVVQLDEPESDPQVAAALAALRRKYPQYATWPVLRGGPRTGPQGGPTLLRFETTAHRSWSAGPEASARALRAASGPAARSATLDRP